METNKHPKFNPRQRRATGARFERFERGCEGERLLSPEVCVTAEGQALAWHHEAPFTVPRCRM